MMDNSEENLVVDTNSDIAVGALLMHDPNDPDGHDGDSLLTDVRLPDEASLMPHDEDKSDHLVGMDTLHMGSERHAPKIIECPDRSEATASTSVEPLKFTDGQPVQLEDGSTAYILTSYKEGSQQIILEDGTTAYITHEPPSSLFAVTHTFHGGTLGLDAVSVLPNEGEQRGDKEGFVEERKAFKCDYEGCVKVYATLHHLQYHRRSHLEKKPFVCGYTGCEKTFATSYSLKSHIRVHTGEKPYKCTHEGCIKGFKTSGDLQKHTRTHTGERPFKCPFEGCTRSFTTSNIRKVHIRTHTGERPYSCEECGRTFASATNYKNHIRIHTGEKPYACTVHGCGRKFTEYSSLYKHQVVHTQHKPYSCPSCGKTYRQTSTLALHRRTAHGETDVVIPDKLADELGLSVTAAYALEQAAKGVVGIMNATPNGSQININKHVMLTATSVQMPSSSVPQSSTVPSSRTETQQVFILPDNSRMKPTELQTNVPPISTITVSTFQSASNLISPMSNPSTVNSVTQLSFHHPNE